MRCKHWVFFMFGIFESIAELLCNRHHWSTHIQKTVPNSFLQVSVYMWMCHECRDCLYSSGNRWATTCIFYRQCFPVYPPSGYQNKVSILSDNTQIYLLWQRNQGMCLFSTVWCLNLLWNDLSAQLPMLYWWGHVCPIAQLAEVNGRVMFAGVLSEAIRQHLPCWFLLSLSTMYVPAWTDEAVALFVLPNGEHTLFHLGSVCQTGRKFGFPCGWTGLLLNKCQHKMLARNGNKTIKSLSIFPHPRPLRN